MEEEKKVKQKKEILLGVLIGIGLIVSFALKQFLDYIAFWAAPETLSGEQGLMEMHMYLYLLILVQILTVIIMPALYIFLCVIYCRLGKAVLHPLIFAGLAVAGLFFASTIVPIRLTGVEIQGEHFSYSKITQIIELLDAVSKDLDKEPVVVCKDAVLSVQSRQLSSSHYTEYYLKEEGGDILCQISGQKFAELSDKLCSLTKHTVRCYPNSRILYDIDGGAELLTEEELLVSLYTITYDEDGYLRWEKNYDVDLENLGMNYYIDGELRLIRSAENDTMDDPVFFDGHDNEAYLTAVYKLGYTRVSNIVNVSEVIDPDAGKEEEEMVHPLDESARAEAEVQLAPQLIPEVEMESMIGSDYLVTSEGLVVAKDNPYYEDVVQAIDAVANANGIKVGSEFKGWYPVASLSFRSSDDDTYFVVYMNTDIDKYEAAPQSEADVYYRINGTIRGTEIERYVAFTPELSLLMEAERNAKAAQIRRMCNKDGELEAHFFYQISSNVVELTVDGFGRIDVLFDPEENELNVMSGFDTMVRVYDIRPVTPEEIEGMEYKPDVAGKVEVMK